MIEEALRSALTNAIPELTNQIYPTNAPEKATKPYLVYARINTDLTKTLEGYTGDQALSYMFSCMATRYADMKSLTEKVKAFLISIVQTKIGKDQDIYIEDMDINNIDEAWEPELKVNRGIIDFTIYI